MKHWLNLLRDWLDRRGLRRERRGPLGLAYNPRHTRFIRAYYLYCVDLVTQSFYRQGHPLNLVFGDYPDAFDNGLPTLRIDLQFEHSLVKPGGRDSFGALPGKIPIQGGKDRYLVRLDRYDYLRQLDLVIEYSRPNLVNIEASGRFEDYLRRTILLHPLFYAPEFGHRPRHLELITLFADTRQPRRRAFLERSQDAGLQVMNVNHIYDQERLRRLYLDTKILINVHQTDHHHTFEELRVLPALLCGVVVISEEVPLKEEIPYSSYILWCDYEKLVERVRWVQNHYADYYRKIFGDPALIELIDRMREHNLDQAELAAQRLGAAPIRAEG